MGGLYVHKFANYFIKKNLILCVLEMSCGSFKLSQTEWRVSENGNFQVSTEMLCQSWLWLGHFITILWWKPFIHSVVLCLLTGDNANPFCRAACFYPVFCSVFTWASIDLTCLFRQGSQTENPNLGSGHQHSPQSLGLCEKNPILWPWRY